MSSYKYIILLFALSFSCNSRKESNYTVIYDLNKSRQVDFNIFLMKGNDTIFSVNSPNYIFMIKNSFITHTHDLKWSCNLLERYPTLKIELPYKIMEGEEKILRKVCELEQYQRGDENKVGVILKNLFFYKNFISSNDSTWADCEMKYRDVVISLRNSKKTNFEELSLIRNFDSCQISNVLATGYYINKSILMKSSDIYFSESGCNYMNVKTSDNDLLIHSKPYYKLSFTYDENTLVPHLKCENPLSLFKKFNF